MASAPGPPRGYRFGPFDVDLATGELRKHGLRVRLQDRPFKILSLLLGRRGDVVTRDQLRHELWPADTFVDFDHNLNNAVNRLREALGDSADSPRFIETLPRHGYRFVAPVERIDAAPAPAPAPPEPAAPAPVPPARGRTRPWLPAAGLAVVVAAILAYALVPRRPASPPNGRVMLAVLPFANLSGDPQQEYFSDGLTEEMIAQLGRLQPAHLAVIARTSAMQYKRTEKRADQIGRELGVDYLLEGSVRHADGRIRITAQLIGARDQANLWSRSYEAELRSTLALQSQVAQAIAEEIRLQLSGEEQARLGRTRPIVPEAYELYLRGRHELNKRTEEGLLRGLDYLERAVAANPDDALAQAGLADAHLLLGSGDYSVRAPREAMPKAKAAAEKALALDDSLASAHTTLAFIDYTYEWDWPAAERSFRRALELDPNDATTHHWYALFLKSLGRREAALAEVRRAQELDPLSLIIGADRAWILFHLRDADGAIAQCRRVLDLDPGFAVAHWNLGLAEVQRGRNDEGIAEFETAARLAGRGPVYVAALGHAYGVAGRTDEARRALAELRQLAERRYVSPGDFALVAVGLGETDEAFRLLEAARAARSDLLVNLKVDPRLDPLRGDVRFKTLLERLGL